MNQNFEKTVLVIGLGNAFRGDEGFGCRVIEMLAMEPLGESVRIMYFGENPRVAGGLIYDADIVIVVGALFAGGVPGRVYKWTYPVFRQHAVWIAAENRSIEYLCEALERAEFAGRVPDSLFFTWIEPLFTEGPTMSPPARKALWRTISWIKGILVKSGALSNGALAVSSLYRFEASSRIFLSRRVETCS